MTFTKMMTWVFVSSTLLLAAGCGHSKAEVAGLKADMKNLKKEHAQMRADFKKENNSARASLKQCIDSSSDLRSAILQHLIYVQSQLVKTLKRNTHIKGLRDFGTREDLLPKRKRP